MQNLSIGDDQARFKRHLRALLSHGNGMPESVIEQERRLEQRIRSSGISDRLAHLLAGVQDAETRGSEPFEIFVMGEGKHGKSTFINAILGHNVAPTDFLPKTWCFNRYIAVDQPSDLVRLFVDPRLMRESGILELKKALGESAGHFRGLLEHRISRRLANEISVAEEHRVAESLGSSKPYFSPVMEMEWAVRAEAALLPGIRLVDTMGINQQLAPASHLHHLKWQYERADAVIWLVTAEKIGAMELRKELLEARRYSKQLLLVINKWDQLSEDSKRRALDRSEKEYGALVTAIVPMSALAAVVARQGLRQEQSDDERHWVRQHQAMSQAEVLAMSGIPEIQRHLEQFLDGRQALTRNLQIYAALRQKGYEFRAMATTARSDAEANIELYEALQGKTVEAKKSTESSISSSTQAMHNSALTRVRQGIQSVDYDSRDRARGLMQLDAINNDLRLLAQNEALAATGRYASILTWLAASAKQYRESHFDATGRVADSIATLCTTKTDVRVEPGNVAWRVPDPTSLLQSVLIRFGEFLSDLPLIGPWIRDKVIEAKAAATAVIRRTLEQEVVPQVEHLIESVRERLIEANRTVGTGLEKDVAEQFEQAGGFDMHRQTIRALDAALSGPAVEPLLVLLPVRMMRRLRWRRS